MNAPKLVQESVQVTAENIGGISRTGVEVSSGVSVLKGNNATNRMSFLQALMAVMGSDQASLKADADQGHFLLNISGVKYDRPPERAGNSVRYEGEKYLEYPTVSELFEFFHETNKSRQAVARGDDLRDLIMCPIDVEDIKQDIDRLTAAKSEINDELATIKSRKQDPFDLEQRRTSLKDEIQTKRQKLAELKDEINESGIEIEGSRRVKEDLKKSLDELRSVRSQLQTVRRDIESKQDSISSLKSEHSDLEEELVALLSSTAIEDEQLADQLMELRDRRRTLNAEISDLQSLISYNRDRLEEADYELLEAFEDVGGTEGGSITDQLLDDSGEEVVCWTCGLGVQQSQIEQTVERSEDHREEKVQQFKQVKFKLGDRKNECEEIERKQRRGKGIDGKVDDIDSEVARREQRIEKLKDVRENLTEKIETLEAEVEDYGSADFEEILSLHGKANQLEFEIERLESDLENIIEIIKQIESMIERADDFRPERADLVEKLTNTRTKIDQIDQDAVEAFNENMNAILDILEYDNLDRIWIDQVEETARNGRETVQQTAFELHVVRTTENDVVYQDTIGHLSESEREVTGLVFALAGYLVHDLHEEVPFMLLDSLEAIDSNRIAHLVEFFSEYTQYLIMSLLPEDAQGVNQDYSRVTSI